VTVGVRGNFFRLLVSILTAMHRQAHVIERYRRPYRGHIEVEATLEDAGTFNRPWKQRSARYLAPSDDVLEYVCSENNSDPNHMT
jgi:hypothetical protein